MFPAGFSYSNNFHLSHNSSRSHGKKTVFEIPEAKINEPRSLSNYISVLSRVYLIP